MIDYKGIVIKFLVLFLLCIKCNIQFVSGGGDGEIRCLEREREALLRFRQGLVDDSGVLSSWGSEDHKKECCQWWGVRCSNTTGHVVGLLLGQDLRGKVSSALLELNHLHYLDLSGNDFGGIRIPGFICSIKNLELLNLRDSNFAGIVPPQLGNLTNLRNLDLSRNYIWSENVNWLSHLSLLSRLDLSYSIINDTNWLKPILKLHSLRELHLKSTNIANVIPPAGLFINSSFTSLSILDMSYNELTSFTIDWLLNTSTSLFSLDLSSTKLERFPKSLENLSHLQILILSHNELGGPLEELLGNLSTKCQLTLREVYLGRNKLTGSVPVSLGELSELKVIDVSWNSLEGTISESNFMKLHNLKAFDLSYNSLTVNISPDWIPPFQWDVINLASCNIGPHFPKWIQTQSNLQVLDLSCNGISGEVPEWLWSLSPDRLEALNVSSNQISGTIPDLVSTFIGLIDVSSNNFSGAIPLFPPEILLIQLSQNMFSGSISSICKIPQASLNLLDLSSNQLSGELPTCWENMTDLVILNLANNSFSGEIPHALGILGNLLTLHLRDNNLSGELPSTLKNLHSLNIIDIGGNMLTGNIPSWIGAYYAKMTIMSLRRNKFYGGIPPEICNLTWIQILDLSENNLSGKIPECLDNFTPFVEKNISHEIIYWGLDLYTSNMSLPSAGLENFDYALVQWKDQELEYRRTLRLLKLIDLSSNRLVGSIPRSFSSLKELISLNLSQNGLTGNIIPDIGQMEMLECLDLSRNQLSGEIPTGLAQLNFLAVLDLANNNLSGRIPSSTQLQSFDASAYTGNYDLCGRPLQLCPEDDLNPYVNSGGQTMKEKNDGFLGLSSMQEFGIAMAFGFILGFWGVVGSLLLKKSWRSAYFNFLDSVGDWLYLTTTIFFNKFRSR